MADKKHFLAEIEETILNNWKQEKTFEKSIEQRSNNKEFIFYDGPPFANGLPHYGHVVQTTIKDAVTRYKTMQGFKVDRRVGWDTHGLPIEYAIEKEHDFKGKQDIVAYGIEKFNQECRDSVFKYKEIWENLFVRLGRWADFSETYTTMDQDYIESVWSVFKTIYDKGLIYKDFRSSPYCPRCATPLSNFELNQGYQDNIEDPSLYVKFKLEDEDAFLLGWTTTPWSLPGNAAIALNPEAVYLYVELEDDNDKKETLILAKNRLSCLNSDDYKIIKEVQASQLIGKSYLPLFNLNYINDLEGKENLYKIWAAEFVSIEDGSGVLHVAPAFGEDDLKLGKENNIPVLLTINEFGKVKSGIGLDPEIENKFFKSADKLIIESLTKQDFVFAAETIKHTYPFCWRCDTPLLYYATDSWLVKVSTMVDKLTSNNQKINWTPKHIRDGRFGNWLANARDWSISRNRFWGAPLPVWVTDDGEITVIGSLEELKARAIDPSLISDLHRPYIDKVMIKTESGKIAKRIDEVFDCWFESGSMPFAQNHYPFENKDNLNNIFPADFIAEAIDQTRGWFYTLHVIAVALFDEPAYKNVICSGWVVAADGEKLSKRKKNYAPMDEVLDQFGVDTLRFFMASSPIVNGEDVRFSTSLLQEVQRKIFMTLNNSFNFYKLYADIDHFKPEKILIEPTPTNVLDRWILARLNQVILDVTKHLDNYRLDKATQPIELLLDDLSNWYIRRSRRRFWKNDNDSDKLSAYETLNYTLLRVCQLLAPFSPFLVDHIWQELTKESNLSQSVHLSDWPNNTTISEDNIIIEMSKTRDFINQGLAQRANSSIKVRQPLASFTILDLNKNYWEIIAEELNVKKIIIGKELALDTNLTQALKEEGIAREVIRNIQSFRKQANFNVEDRIAIKLTTTDEAIQKALINQKELIDTETLTSKDLSTDDQIEYSGEFKVNGVGIELSISRIK